jgi:hypothetical protein
MQALYRARAGGDLREFERRQAADLRGGTLGVSRSALGGARFELVFRSAADA